MPVDIVWTITAALLVYFMHGGFGFFEAGMCHSKNTVDTMQASKSIALVVVNTALGGSAGAVAAMVGSRLWTGKVSLRTVVVGLLTANVAVTSPSGVVDPWAAASIGALGWLRVSREEEEEGSDRAAHGEEAYEGE